MTFAIVAGAFSFRDWWCTFGDTEAMLVVRSWLEDAGIPFHVACHPDNGVEGVDINAVDPADYTVFIYVCGPWNEPRRDRFFARFGHCTKIGVNVSVLNADHGFDIVYARDLADACSPDLSLARPPAPIRPVVGLCLVHPQEEYGDRQRHDVVSREVMRFCEKHDVSAIPIDTLCANNPTSTRTVRQFEALVSRMDYVITSRLHGLVLSIRAGVPVVAIDPIAGGGKVTAQVRAVEWPLLIQADRLSPDAISEMADQCRSGRMGPYLARARHLGAASAARTKDAFTAFVTSRP